MDATEVYNQLKEEIQSVEWEAIAPHHEREAVFLCAAELDLAELGSFIALDEVDKVKDLMSKGQLRKIEAEEGKAYASDKKLLFVIVQPFVFVQELH